MGEGRGQPGGWGSIEWTATYPFWPGCGRRVAPGFIVDLGNGSGYSTASGCGPEETPVMSYYRVLGLDKEPFSTSPDPDFFYQSDEHKAALNNILIEVRLRRGLSVILGDIGTGKTTLSRKLFQLIADRKDINFYMILDPTYDSEELFLLSLISAFGIEINTATGNILDFKAAIKDFLFQQGVNENKTIGRKCFG